MGLLSGRKATQIKPKVPREVKDSEDDEATPEAEPSATDIKAKRRVIAIEGNNQLVYDGSRIEVIPIDSEEDLDVEIEFKGFFPGEHTVYLEKLVAEAEKAQEEARKKPSTTETDEERNFAKEYFEKKLCGKVMKSGEFHNYRIVVRIEVEEEKTGRKIGKHCTKTQHKRYCDRLGIDDFSRLEPGAGQYQDDLPAVAQAHSAATKSDDTPKTSNTDEYDKLTDDLIFDEQKKLIDANGQVVIAFEERDDINYCMIRDRDRVRILEEDDETNNYEEFTGTGKDSNMFGPPSHFEKLQQYAAKGLDSFRYNVIRVRIAEKDCKAIKEDIWLMLMRNGKTELRCNSSDGGKLLEKLGVFDLDTLMTLLNPTSASQATEPNTPSPPPQKFARKRTGRTTSPGVMESIEESTVTLYKPGDGSGKYRHIASNVGDFNGKLQDNTECIVQNSDDDKFRIWTWAQVSEFNAEENTIAHVFDERNKKDRCRSHREFHFPDEEGMKELLKQGNLLPTEYSIEVILTWRVKDSKKEDGYKYSNSVLLNITNEKKKKIVLDARKKRDYKYEGPSRCSITTFRSLVGSDKEANKQVIHKLQKDTEAGQGYYETLQKRLDGRAGSRDGSRSKSRDCTPSTADQRTELQEKNKKLQEELAKAKEQLQQLRPAFHEALSQQAKV